MPSSFQYFKSAYLSSTFLFVDTYIQLSFILNMRVLLIALLAAISYAQTARCGSSWGDANGKCGTPCPSLTDAECTNGETCSADLSELPCDNGSTTSTTTTSSSSNDPVNPTGETCVHHSVMTCINDISSYWPKCDPGQSKNNAGPSGYEFGHYCTQEWVDAFNEMMSSSQVNKCNDREVVKRTLAQIAYETGYYSTVYQPIDGGAGLIHMIPNNWVINAADMDDVFNTGSTYETAATEMGKNFFQDNRYGWKSVAAWFLSTNRVIPGCDINLFDASYSEMTRCIFSQVNDRSEAYQHVSQCMDAYDAANLESTSTTSHELTSEPTARCGSSWGDANGKCGTPCPSLTDAECTNGETCSADLSVLPCDNGSTTSTTTTSSSSNDSVNPTDSSSVGIYTYMTTIMLLVGFMAIL